MLSRNSLVNRNGNNQFVTAEITANKNLATFGQSLSLTHGRTLGVVMGTMM